MKIKSKIIYKCECNKEEKAYQYKNEYQNSKANKYKYVHGYDDHETIGTTR